MTIELLLNELEGKFAFPKNYPITCSNPAPWEITQMTIRINPLKVWIRGDKSIIMGNKNSLQRIQLIEYIELILKE